MEEHVYNKLRKEWHAINKKKIPGGKRNIYYKIRPGEKKHVEKPAQMKHLHLFKDKFVVDIGCNAGYITYNIAKHAKGWVGIDRSPTWFAQAALATAKVIETPGEFLNCTIEHFCENLESNYDYDALFASNILYYLTPNELQLLQDKVLSKCNMVMMVSREDKPTKRYNDRELGKYKNIQKFLEECNFNIELFDLDSNWVTVVGRK